MQVSVAAGLVNGKMSAPGVFPMMLANDKLWIQSVIQDDASIRVAPISPDELVREGVNLGEEAHKRSAVAIVAHSELWATATVWTVDTV